MGGVKPGALNEEQLQKAVAALQKYVGKRQEESNNLLEEDELLQLVRPAPACRCKPSPQAAATPPHSQKRYGELDSPHSYARVRFRAWATSMARAMAPAAGRGAQENPAEAQERQTAADTPAAPHLRRGGRGALPVRQGPRRRAEQSRTRRRVRCSRAQWQRQRRRPRALPLDLGRSPPGADCRRRGSQGRQAQGKRGAGGGRGQGRRHLQAPVSERPPLDPRHTSHARAAAWRNSR